MAFSDYSATPSANTTIAGQNIAPGGPPSAVGPGIRQLMSDGKNVSTALGYSVVFKGTAGNGTTPDRVAFQAGLDYQNTTSVGSFQLIVPDARYALSNTGGAVLRVQNGTKVVGGSLEGTQLIVQAGSTATSLLKDAGSAAKIELYNLTANGNGNTALLALYDFGTDGSIQFGAYARLDNLMGRDAPNATAFNINTNISAFGDLYSITTRDGFVTANGSVGAMVKSIFPYDFSRYGIRFGGIGDSVIQSECEAPSSDAAIPWFAAVDGSFGVGTQILSLQSGRVTATPMAYCPANGARGIISGPVRFIRRDYTSRFGNKASPLASGTSTGIGTNTLTDTSKSWTRDQWKGGAIFITSGTGNGNWAEIASNTKDTITIANSGWFSRVATMGDPTVINIPVTGDQYALDLFVKAVSNTGSATGDGQMFAPYGFNAPDAAFVRATIGDQVSNTSLVGSSNDAAKMSQRLRKVATLDFASIAAQSVGTGLTVTLQLAAIGDAVRITPPAAAAAQGVIYDGVVTGANTVTIYPKNITSAAIDPASGDFTVEVRKYV